MEASFTFLDLRCFADPTDARHYYFLPTTPDLQRDADLRPMITMIDVGSSGYVMFTATWAARPESVTALTREIAAGHQDPDATRIRVSFAPITSPQCHVLLGDGRGVLQTIATSATSRMPPFDALFNLPVQNERLDQVRAAVRGEPGFLAIEYVADLRVPSTGTATFRADAGELISWLRSERHSGKSLRALLEEAVEASLATVAVNVSERTGGDVAVELFDRVLNQVAEVAPRWIAEGGSGAIEVAASIERGSREPIRALADIGRIVASGSLRPS
jgi:hypothetical protein